MRTVGVEEELIVVGLDDGHPLAVGDIVVERASSEAASESSLSASQFEAEFKKEQAELGSSPSTCLVDVGRELHELRLRMSRAAGRHRAAVVAMASSPFKVSPTASSGRRYAAMMDRFGLLARQQLTCGQHVHVSISSPEEGVAVLDRIRPWLAVLTALSANSPFWQGQDSCYASYRSVMWGLWPTAGPTERFGSVRGYERALHERLASGAAMDPECCTSMLGSPRTIRPSRSGCRTSAPTPPMRC